MNQANFPSVFLFVLFLFGAQSLLGQFTNYGYADSTQILLVFENEQDTASINALKNELQATELGSTPLTRVHLWQIPLDTVLAYGGPIEIQNHAIGKAVIRDGGMNFSVPIIAPIDDDDDDDDDDNNGSNCYPNSMFACTPGANPVSLAFTDTGLDGFALSNSTIWRNNHPWFSGRLWGNSGEIGQPLNSDDDSNGYIDDGRGWNFSGIDNLPLDENAHGTHVAGIAADKFQQNSDGKINKLMVLKTHNAEGYASMWELVQGIDYAIRQNAKVVNMSLSYLSPLDTLGKPSIMEYLMDFAKIHNNTLFVAAAGNDSLNIDAPLTLSDGTPVKLYPANLPNDNLIVVAAGTCSNDLASFSNYGASSVDIAAPGVGIYSSILSGNFGYLSGSSMAAPHVAAAAVLAGTSQPNFHWKKIKTDLLNKSSSSSSLAGVTTSGKMLAFCNTYSGSDVFVVGVKANNYLCQGGSTSLMATPLGGNSPYSYSWSNGATTANTSVTLAGVYTVTVTDAQGTTATESVTVSALSAPFAQVNFAPIACNESSTVLTIENQIGGATYVWNTGITGTTLSVSPSVTTTYTVTTTLTSGCSSTSSITVPVNKLMATLNPDTICKGSCVTLSPTVVGGTAPYQYAWNTGESESSVIKCPNVSTTYRVTVTSGEGCTTTATRRIIVKAAPVLATIPARTICPCGSTTITALTTGGTIPYTYSWAPGGETTASITVSPTNTTTNYGVTVSDVFGCTHSRTTNISLKCERPIANAPSIHATNQTVTFTWNPICSVTSWQLRWRCTTSDAWIVTNISNPNTTSNTFNLPGGCTNPMWQIRGRCCNNVWSSWSPLSRAREQEFSVRKKDIEEANEVEVFPNPTSGMIYVQTTNFESNSLLNVQISSSDGRLVQVETLNAPLDGIAPVFVGHLDDGLYFIRLFDSQKSFFGRIIVLKD